jgi:hypothetical protein
MTQNKKYMKIFLCGGDSYNTSVGWTHSSTFQSTLVLMKVLIIENNTVGYLQTILHNLKFDIHNTPKFN